MNNDVVYWQPKPRVDSPHLVALLAAWQNWANVEPIPPRARFDPFEFPALLPLMVLSEIVPQPNAIRDYDVLYRYIGSDFSTFFDSGKVTRAHLSEIGAPFDERWFAIGDAVLAARGPQMFQGSPLDTPYSHVMLEMLALPFARTPFAGPQFARQGTEADRGEIGFVLCALARAYPDGA